MQAPLSHMDDLGSDEVTVALLRLHALLGAKVKVTVNFFGQFFGCGLQGELSRVETLPPDHSAIALLIDGAQGFFLDPSEATIELNGGVDTDWLEFRMSSGVAVVIERCAVAETHGGPHGE